MSRSFIRSMTITAIAIGGLITGQFAFQSAARAARPRSTSGPTDQDIAREVHDRFAELSSDLASSRSTRLPEAAKP
jgi:hypothetical protein